MSSIVTITSSLYYKTHSFYMVKLNYHMAGAVMNLRSVCAINVSAMSLNNNRNCLLPRKQFILFPSAFK